jgi:hypothetical protein
MLFHIGKIDRRTAETVFLIRCGSKGEPRVGGEKLIDQKRIHDGTCVSGMVIVGFLMPCPLGSDQCALKFRRAVESKEKSLSSEWQEKIVTTRQTCHQTELIKPIGA